MAGLASRLVSVTPHGRSNGCASTAVAPPSVSMGAEVIVDPFDPGYSLDRLRLCD
jgi:hypothetical protein